MKYINQTYLLLFVVVLFTACSSNDIAEDTQLPVLPGENTWEEKDVDGSSVTIKPFLPGDAVSRSSYAFDGQKLVFGWETNDKVGIYPTAMKPLTEDDENSCLDATTYPHPYSSDGIKRINPAKSSQQSFICNEADESQTSKITNESNPDYIWDENGRWTAYFPYKGVDPEQESYETRTYSFAGQTQEGLPNMTAFYSGDGGYAAGATNPLYKESEALACQHLGAKDVLISSEAEWNSYRIRFYMRHLGAVLRLFLLAPEEDLVIKNIKLICDTPIFYEEGEFNLKSHPYDASKENMGVNLELYKSPDKEDCQIKPIGEPQKMIELNFKGETAKTYVESTMLKRYLVAYMMTYPITYDPATHGNLFAYVTAYKQGDTSKKEYHFVTNPLAGKVMKPGYYYQWVEMTHPDDGLYPIEMTATLKPWQEIVGADIDLDLEK